MDPELVDRIYEASIVPELWPMLLAQLCQLSGAFAAALLIVDDLKSMRAITTPGYKEPFARFLEGGSKYENLRASRFLERQYQGFLTDLELMSAEELANDPIYTEFLYPAGIRWTAGTVIVAPGGDIMIFDFANRQQDGPFQRKTMALLDSYRPDLSRASMISARLGLKSADQAANAMEIVGYPAAAISAGGKILAMNSLFGEIEPKVLSSASGRLSLVNEQADELLQQALRSGNDDGGLQARSIPVPSSAKEPALVIHLVPIKRTARSMFSAAAMLIVTKISSPPAPTSELLNGLFDLTPAEARLARAIAEGVSLGDFSSSASLSKETVRTQLKSVMAKTGTHRQSDLATLLVAATPFPRNPA